jgi:hypothetical protein
MYNLNDIPLGRVNIAVAMIMNEAVARGHKENGLGYTPMSRFMSILMDINEEVNRGVNERMDKILQGEMKRAELEREAVEQATSAKAMLALSPQ